jgi:hypothetical protein
MYEKKHTRSSRHVRVSSPVGCCEPSLTCVGLRWPSLAAVDFRGPVVGRTRVRLLVRMFMEPRKKKKLKKSVEPPDNPTIHLLLEVELHMSSTSNKRYF